MYISTPHDPISTLSCHTGAGEMTPSMTLQRTFGLEAAVSVEVGCRLDLCNARPGIANITGAIIAL